MPALQETREQDQSRHLFRWPGGAIRILYLEVPTLQETREQDQGRHLTGGREGPPDLLSGDYSPPPREWT